MGVFSEPSAYFESVSQTTATNSVEVGTCRRSGDEEYIYVYNTGASDLPVGHAAVMSAVTGYSVTVSSVTGVDFAVGVCKHAAISASCYGWLLTKGFTTVEMAISDSAAAGQALRLALSGTFALASQVTGSPSPVVGKSMEAIASAASGSAYISVY
jgi:hypothetical protein